MQAVQSKCHLTWNINYFLVHIQESVLGLFTSLTQRINLQQRMREGGGGKRRMVNCQLHHLTAKCHIQTLQSQAH